MLAHFEHTVWMGSGEWDYAAGGVSEDSLDILLLENGVTNWSTLQPI